jgi:CRP-like cAMP-binding protein
MPTNSIPREHTSTDRWPAPQARCLFSGLAGDDARRLAEAAVTVSADAGERVVTLAELGDEAFLIIAGTVVVEDETRIRAHLRTGELFGEIATLSFGREYRMRRTATVRAATPLQLIRIRGAELQELSGTHPWLRRSLQQLVSDRLTPADLRRHLTNGTDDRKDPVMTSRSGSPWRGR